MFDDLDKVGTNVVLSRGCPQSSMQNLVKGLLEDCEDMVEVLLGLDTLLTQDSQVKICSLVPLPAVKCACFSAMVFSTCGFSLFSMICSITLCGWLMRLNIR